AEPLFVAVHAATVGVIRGHEKAPRFARGSEISVLSKKLYFLPRPRFTLSESRRSFPALKRTFFDAGMVIFSFVRGLRPSRALRCETEKLPRPGIAQRSPFWHDSEM